MKPRPATYKTLGILFSEPQFPYLRVIIVFHRAIGGAKWFNECETFITVLINIRLYNECMVSSWLFSGIHETDKRALKMPEDAQTTSNGKPNFWLKRFPGGERAFLQEQSVNEHNTLFKKKSLIRFKTC